MSLTSDQHTDEYTTHSRNILRSAVRIWGNNQTSYRGTDVVTSSQSLIVVAETLPGFDVSRARETGLFLNTNTFFSKGDDLLVCLCCDGFDGHENWQIVV